MQFLQYLNCQFCFDYDFPLRHCIYLSQLLKETFVGHTILNIFFKIYLLLCLLILIHIVYKYKCRQRSLICCLFGGGGGVMLKRKHLRINQNGAYFLYFISDFFNKRKNFLSHCKKKNDFSVLMNTEVNILYFFKYLMKAQIYLC